MFGSGGVKKKLTVVIGMTIKRLSFKRKVSLILHFMKFPHLGDNTVPGPRGNLFVEIHINHKPNWSRNQNDLKTSIIVNCLELITGTKIKVHTLDNRDIEITIPQGTKNGTTFSVHGHGVPDVHYGQKGKLLITIQASIPQDLKDRELDQIREIIRDNGKL